MAGGAAYAGTPVGYCVCEGDLMNVGAAGKDETYAFVKRPALAGGIGPPLFARVRLLAGTTTGFLFSVLTFSSCSSRFLRFSAGNSSSSLYSSMHLITARSADCSFLAARC